MREVEPHTHTDVKKTDLRSKDGREKATRDLSSHGEVEEARHRLLGSLGRQCKPKHLPSNPSLKNYHRRAGETAQQINASQTP